MHRLGPFGNLEFAQHVGDVVAYRLGTQDEASGLNPIHARHFDIHQDHIGLQSARLDKHFFPHRHLADDLHIRDRLQQGTQAVADKHILIEASQQVSDGAGDNMCS